MTEIAKCPYCGSNAVGVKTDDTDHWVMCIDCEMGGPKKNTSAAAIEAWKRVVRMREALEGNCFMQRLLEQNFFLVLAVAIVLGFAVYGLYSLIAG